MKLYFSPGACSLSPHIVACEAGITLALERVDLRTKKTETGADFTRINPKGYVPALELDDGQMLTEGPAIVQYLADRAPKTGLAPQAGTMERYRLQEWLGFIGTEIHKSFGALFSPKAPDAWKATAREMIANRLDYVANELQGKAFLMGDTFTVADAYLFTVLGWTKHVGIDMTRWPALTQYCERIAARPAVQAAQKAERSAS